MQIKSNKDIPARVLLIAVLLSGLFLVASARNANFEEVRWEIKESFLAMDPGVSGITNFSELINQLPDIIDGKLNGFRNRPGMETVYVDINPREYRTLLSDRKKAISDNVLTDPREIKGKIRFRGKQLKADIRLKGDMNDHWLSQTRMSLRIKLKNDQSILNYNEFSIQKPWARQHPYDSLFQRVVRDSGNLSSVQEYVQVVFNGEPWGVMIMEESMTSEFLEKLGRKESLIVRFSNEDHGVVSEHLVQQGIPLYNDYRLSDDRLYLKIYEEGKYAQNPDFRKYYSHIAQSRARQSEIQDGLYDIDAYGRALMITAIWNEAHPLWHANSRHYFNPYTLRLEPVTTDATIPYSMRVHEMLFPRRSVSPETNTPLETNSIYNRIINTGHFQENMGRYFDEVAPALQKASDDYAFYHAYFPMDPFQHGFPRILSDNILYFAQPEFRSYVFSPRQLSIDMELQPPDDMQAALFTDHVHIRHFDNGRIDIYNLLPDTVYLDKLVMDDSSEIPLGMTLEAYKPGQYTPLTLMTNITGIVDARLKIQTVYRDLPRETHAGLSLVTENMHNPLLAETQPGQFPFIEQDNGQWSFRPGDWEIAAPLVLAGNVRIGPGTRLKFHDDAYMIVKGGLNITGTPEEPVVMEAAADSWKGVYVMEAGIQSEWQHVTIRDYGATQDGLLSLTGGVTFYRSDVQMDNVFLNGARGEDALNLVQSQFGISNSVIQNTASDGLDSDFSNGAITSTAFSGINGDAMDFSGSVVTISESRADDIYDKAVSVGEASTVRIHDAEFNNVGVAVVSKDGSSAEGSNLKIGEYTLAAAMSYQKKSFYDSASLTLENIDVTGQSPYVRQTGSQMSVDSNPLREQDVDVDFLYENTVMSK